MSDDAELEAERSIIVQSMIREWREQGFTVTPDGPGVWSVVDGVREPVAEYGIDPHLYRPPVRVEITAFGDDVPTFVVGGTQPPISISSEHLVSGRTFGSFIEDPDEHSGNGDDLRRLDEVLEEQRQRIVALGRRA